MFYSLNPNDSRAKEWHESKSVLEAIKKDDKRFRVNPLDINSEYADFGAALYCWTFNLEDLVCGSQVKITEGC